MFAKKLSQHRAVRPLAVLLLSAALAAPAFALTEQERQQRLEALRATIEQVRKELENVKTSRTEMMEELEESESRIGELNKKVDELQNELENKQSQIKGLREEKQELARAKKQQTQSAGTQLNAAYRLGAQSQVKLLLNQQNPATVTRNLKYWDYITRARKAKLQEFASTLARIQELEPRIAAESLAISERQQQLKTQSAALNKHQAQRKKTLEKLNRTLASHDSKLNGLQQDRQDLESLVVEVARTTQGFTGSQNYAANNGAAFSQLKGKLPWPASGRVVQPFGSDRVKGKLRWQGVLISADEGTPVRAVHDGQVVFCDYLRGQGLLIIVDHGGGFMSLYAHNAALHKRLGDFVEAGEQIASVGVSGGQGSASLYFELRFKGEPTNPQAWLSRA